MNWRDYFHLDLGALLHGHVEVLPSSSLKKKKSAFSKVRYSVLTHVASHFTPYKRLLLLTRQLLSISTINASYPEALEQLALDAPIGVSRVMLLLRVNLLLGYSLSESMARIPKIFPAWYIDMVRTGENTGALRHTFQTLNDLIQERHIISQTYIRRTLYIIFMCFVLCQMYTFMSIKIYPILIEILADYNNSPPLPLEFLLTIDDFSRAYIGPAGIVGTIILFMFIVLSYISICRRLIGWLLCIVPPIGKWFIKGDLAHVARLLARLIEVGIPIDEALHTVEQSTIRPRLAAALHRIRDKVCSGYSLVESLKQENAIIPASFTAAIALGENSTHLAANLDRLAIVYTTRLLTVERTLVGIAFPLGIILIGCGVLSIVASGFIPISMITDFVY